MQGLSENLSCPELAVNPVGIGRRGREGTLFEGGVNNDGFEPLRGLLWKISDKQESQTRDGTSISYARKNRTLSKLNEGGGESRSEVVQSLDVPRYISIYLSYIC